MVKLKMIETLPIEQKAIILDEFIQRIKKREGIYGYIQIIELLDEIAIQKHLVQCPYCKRK